MLESELEAKIRDYARGRGYLVFKFVSPGNPGVPDRIFISPTGQVGFLELKAPGKKPRTLQSFNIQKINAHHVPAAYADSFDTAKAFVDSLYRQSVPARNLS